MKKECIKLDTLFKQGKRLQTKWVEMKWDKHGNLAAEREETILITLTSIKGPLTLLVPQSSQLRRNKKKF